MRGACALSAAPVSDAAAKMARREVRMSWPAASGRARYKILPWGRARQCRGSLGGSLPGTCFAIRGGQLRVTGRLTAGGTMADKITDRMSDPSNRYPRANEPDETESVSETKLKGVKNKVVGGAKEAVGKVPDRG